MNHNQESILILQSLLIKHSDEINKEQNAENMKKIQSRIDAVRALIEHHIEVSRTPWYT